MIVLKALRKLPERRSATIEALRQDIGRFLGDAPTRLPSTANSFE